MPKRIILITIDCLRPDHLQLYGYNKNIAPNIEKVSKRAIIFDNAIANSAYTVGSFYSIFTSTTPTLDGDYAPIPNYKRILAEILQEDSILTCAIHSNPHLGKLCNYHKGFDDFIDLKDSQQQTVKQNFKKKVSLIVNRLKLNKLIEKLSQNVNLIDRLPSFVLEMKSPYADAKTITINALNWLKKNYNKSFFLWIHFMDAHRPYLPHPEYIKKVSNKTFSSSEIRQLNNTFNFTEDSDVYKTISNEFINNVKVLYDTGIYYIDHFLGILFTYLKKLAIFDSTNLIITSDHGQSLFNHNKISHRDSLYDELLKVPFIIKPDYLAIKQKRIKDQIELNDLAPTILNFFNIAKEKDFSGVNLIPLIEGENNFFHSNYVISAFYHKKQSMYGFLNKENFKFFIKISCRTTNWKLIYDDETKKIEFFNLKKDPHELIDLNNSIIEEVVYIKNELFKKIKPLIKSYDLEKNKVISAVQIKKDFLKNI